MKITYLEKNLLLYDTATFLAVGLGATEIEFGDKEKGEVLYVTLNLIENKDKEPSFSWEAIDENHGTATLTNWNHPAGVTLTQPITGGSLFDKDMLFTFSVRKVGAEGETREVTFSVYIDKGTD